MLDLGAKGGGRAKWMEEVKRQRLRDSPTMLTPPLLSISSALCRLASAARL